MWTSIKYYTRPYVSIEYLQKHVRWHILLLLFRLVSLYILLEWIFKRVIIQSTLLLLFIFIIHYTSLLYKKAHIIWRKKRKKSRKVLSLSSLNVLNIQTKAISYIFAIYTGEQWWRWKLLWAKCLFNIMRLCIKRFALILPCFYKKKQ